MATLLFITTWKISGGKGAHIKFPQIFFIGEKHLVEI